MKAMARDLGCYEKTIRDCVSEDLMSRSYKMQVGQILTQKADEVNKIAQQAQAPKKVNKQNNRWIATCTSHVRKVMKTKFPAMVMVFGVVRGEGHVMPPHIFETGLKVNTEVYLDVMEKVVLPWIQGMAGNRPWVWQHDSAPCHVSKISMQFVNRYDVVTKDLWPPNSPGLNPLDYFVWGYVERHTNRHPHSTKVSLMDSIKEVFGNMDNEMVRRACGRFRGRIKAFIDANGDDIK
ncbi:unnamed protein product [Lepeophtheirus salmonis]|uniref:(salmon louse) hypothetical protein n=1 Tax=Lepeophtheirus salmonis TaxID=72036 RepID=A0A7R8CI68_LEPSM|nr:unnamed protein product [Lepeophtheirus salmonis]CAF2829536.1 unnamed protein product [Lepeophtheirus salmonis]